MLKTGLFLVIFLHGLIHLMGFAKAFGYANLPQLTKEISRPAGVLWLCTAILFSTAAIFFILKKEGWWLIALPAVVLSQFLVITHWQNAKFGTIANLIILIASLGGYGNWSFYNRYKNDVKQESLQENYFGDGILTESDMEHLPESVKKYLRFTGSVGKPKVNRFRVTFKGKIRKNEQSAWMPLTSEQYNFMKFPARLFFMNASMKGLPVGGYHRFANGKANMDIRLLSLFQVQYLDGEEMDMAETVTFFNDMCCMAPATLIDPRITWKEVYGNNVMATFTHNGITITAELYFNEKGELVNFISNDRYNVDAGKKLTWSTPQKDYREINGYKLATHAETVYSYPEGEVTYGIFQLSSVEYNGRAPK